MASGEHPCVVVWNWIASFLIWSAVLFLLYVIIAKPGGDMINVAYVFLGIASLAYFISAFCASTCCYLMNPTNGSDIYGYMQSMFYTPVHKVMSVQCYHYETRHHTERDSNGNNHTRTETVRVNTHSASERFYYISWRDISGRFVLDTSGAMVNQKLAFVKLHLALDMIFAQDGTQQDYERQRELFKARNRWDTHQDYSESLAMDGYNEFNLVRVSDYKPACFNMGWYFIFTLLLAVEFYKMYVDKFCIVQNFMVAKVVSSRRDLNSSQVITEYIPLMPCIVYMGEVRQFAEIPKMVPMTAPPTESAQIQVNMPSGVVPGVNMQMNVGMPEIAMQPGVPPMGMTMNVTMNANSNTPLLH